MAKAKDQIRIDALTGEESAIGRLFMDSGSAALTDLSAVRLLRCGVDTVRQLYKGVIRPDVRALFEQVGIVSFAGHDWAVGRIGRDSGYQFRLQNADLGFILLIKSFNAQIDQFGSHLKIEVSPHAIEALSPEQLQAHIDRLAHAVLESAELNQCAVHLALDFQGWTPPADFTARMHCRARSQRDITGIDRIEWASKASVYGRGQTYMFGSASGVQLSLYNKTEQAKAIDKLDYWQSVWLQSDNPFDPADTFNYDPDQPVWRLELRYHHSVVQQFADGSINTFTGAVIDTRSFSGIAPHLDGLWRYGLDSFRFLARPGHFDAFWTLIRSDVRVSVSAEPLDGQTVYKRYYKTAQGFSGKNVELFLGNFVSLLARERVPAKKAFKCLKQWDCWGVVREHYACKGMSEGKLFEHIEKLLKERHVRWGRAV